VRRVARVEGLDPGSPPLSYRWQVRDGRNWRDVDGPGTAGTVALPPTNDPSRFVLAVTSCNNVLTDYPPFPPNPQERWQALSELMKREQVDLLVHSRDQVYLDPIFADYMTDTGGYESDPARLRQAIAGWPLEVRRRYFRHFTSAVAGGIQDVLAVGPSVMMWDDHELYDGWGSQTHPDLRGWNAWEKIATTAFRDFQASHNPNPLPGAGVGFAFRRGAIGFLALDLRSFRGRDPAYPMLGSTQLSAARDWWSREKDNVAVLIVLSSTPLGTSGARRGRSSTSTWCSFSGATTWRISGRARSTATRSS
jgi:phosphodiesterase/alkaline phosphatase D-like protein